MRRYRFTRDYASGAGTWAAGDEAEFSEDFAAWLNRDVAGCVVPADEPEPESAPEARAVEEPPQDRQVKRAPRTRGRS